MLKKYSRRLSKNVIKANVGTFAFNTILQIYCRSFFIYLATKRVAKRAFGIEVKLLNNIKSLGNLLRSLSGKIDLEKLELGRLNAKLGL